MTALLHARCWSSAETLAVDVDVLTGGFERKGVSADMLRRGAEWRVLDVGGRPLLAVVVRLSRADWQAVRGTLVT